MSRYASAMHANFVRAVCGVGGAAPGGAVAALGPWRLLDAGRGFEDFSAAFRTAPARGPAAAVAEACSWFVERGAPPRFLLREPGDAALAAACRARGFAPEGGIPAMLLERPADLSAPAVRFEAGPVIDYEGLCAWASLDEGGADGQLLLARGAAAEPGFTLVTVRAGSETVGRALCVVTGAMGGVYSMLVTPAHRGHGAGRALALATVAAAVAAGAATVCLQSTPAGYPLYESLGFRTVYHYVAYGAAAR